LIQSCTGKTGPSKGALRRRPASGEKTALTSRNWSGITHRESFRSIIFAQTKTAGFCPPLCLDGYPGSPRLLANVFQCVAGVHADTEARETASEEARAKVQAIGQVKQRHQKACSAKKRYLPQNVEITR
jgi:hypothetical protein